MSDTQKSQGAPKELTYVEQLQAKLLELQINEIETARATKLKAFEEEQEVLRRQKEIGLKAMEKQWRDQEAMREQCNHLKPNAKPNIGGQRDHGRHIHWICLMCGKEWQDNFLPLPLRVGLNMDIIGGPTL